MPYMEVSVAGSVDDHDRVGALSGVVSVDAIPNPTELPARITYRAWSDMEVQAVVFDVVGRSVRDLGKNRVAAGRHALVWDGRDSAGNRVAAGVYWISIRAANRAGAKRMILLR